MGTLVEPDRYIYRRALHARVYALEIIPKYMMTASERGEHRPIGWGRRVCGGLSSTLGVARCGRSAGCVLCLLWAISAAVWGGSTLWG